MRRLKVVNRIRAREKIEMISVTVEPNIVSIAIDAAGIHRLIEWLRSVQRDGGHIHLRSEFAGGDELASNSPWGSKAIDELIIDYIDTD